MKHPRPGTAVLAPLVIATVCGALVIAPAAATPSGGAAPGPAVAEQPAALPADPDAFVDGEVLVTWADDTSRADKRDARDDAGLDADAAAVAGQTEVATIADGAAVADVVDELGDDPRVESVQPNFRYRRAVSDPYYKYQWGLHNTGQTVGTSGVSNVDVDGPDAWTRTKGATSTVVAVIDTGIQIGHPDLKDNIWVNTLEKNGTTGVDDDGNGYVDDVNGWDFLPAFEGDDGNNSVYDGTYCPGYGNNDDHGTHVAGIIAASDNTVGVSGIAPDIKVMPLKIIGCDDGSTFELVSAIRYAQRKGVKVVNLSLGGPTYDSYLYSVMKSAGSSGMLFVAAAGNGDVGGRISRCYTAGGDPVSSCPMYPAAFNLDNIISVAAMTNRGALAAFSQYGSRGPDGTYATGVDVAAPGQNVLSTVPGGNGLNASATWGYLSGTSMASPYVTGVAALVKSYYPTWASWQIRSRVISSGRWFSGSGSGRTVSGRMVNAANALGRTSLYADSTRSWVTSGDDVYIKATLVNGAPVGSGQKLTLQRYVPSSGAWVATCATTTRSDGTASCRRYPTERTSYRWLYAGSGTSLSPSVSATVTVAVKASVRLSPGSSSISHGRSVTFTSAVAPQHAGQQVRLQMKSGSTWRTVTTRTLNSSSKAAIQVSFPKQGTTYWRAYFPGDADHWSNVSPTAKVVAW